ncbi:MAG: phosphodiesterase [Lentisphaeria bacterium]|nr:phosphodiesterase [Lentisphaeria bacterium]MBR2720021.1 phosphodiesterase [Lentisphaeria bacterium]
MKIMFISDIHGMHQTLKQALDHADRLSVDQIVILGDILYHGPRNGVPSVYDPAAVADMLNERKDQILAVRGNCDAEVDQMMLKFPIMADYSELICGNNRFFLTHGHLWNENHLPDLPAGTILAHGHTHIPELKIRFQEKIWIFNPGSISLPKNGNIRTFGLFHDGKLTVNDLESGNFTGGFHNEF